MITFKNIREFKVRHYKNAPLFMALPFVFLRNCCLLLSFLTCVVVQSLKKVFFFFSYLNINISVINSLKMKVFVK